MTSSTPAIVSKVWPLVKSGCPLPDLQRIFVCAFDGERRVKWKENGFSSSCRFSGCTTLRTLENGPDRICQRIFVSYISPVAWQHINFYGRYEFTKAPEPINLKEIVEALAQHPLLALLHEGHT